jgi:hypothetical protein
MPQRRLSEDKVYTIQHERKETMQLVDLTGYMEIADARRWTLIDKSSAFFMVLVHWGRTQGMSA